MLYMVEQTHSRPRLLLVAKVDPTLNMYAIVSSHEQGMLCLCDAGSSVRRALSSLEAEWQVPTAAAAVRSWP